MADTRVLAEPVDVDRHAIDRLEPDEENLGLDGRTAS